MMGNVRGFRRAAKTKRKDLAGEGWMIPADDDEDRRLHYWVPPDAHPGVTIEAQRTTRVTLCSSKRSLVNENPEPTWSFLSAVRACTDNVMPDALPESHRHLAALCAECELRLRVALCETAIEMLAAHTRIPLEGGEQAEKPN